MRSALAYAPRRGVFGRVGAGSASLYLGSLALVAFLYSNPIVLAATAAAVAIAGFRAGAGRALAAAARWGAALGALVVAVNAVTAQRGDTILVRGWHLPLLGQLDVSGEALAEGAIVGLRIAIVLCAFAVHSACVDPDRMLRLLRPLARHSALTATLITRLVPLAAADHARLAEAARLRGPAAAPVGRPALARRLVAGSLDRAVDVAAALELRGYARGVPGHRGAVRSSRHSWRFAAAGVAVVVIAIAGRLAGVASFDPYPTVEIAAGPSTLALALLLPTLAAAPFIGLGSRDG